MTDAEIIADQTREIMMLRAQLAAANQKVRELQAELKCELIGPAARPKGLTYTQNRVARILAVNGRVDKTTLGQSSDNASGAFISRLRRALPPGVVLKSVRSYGYEVFEGLDILRRLYGLPVETTSQDKDP